MTPIQKQILACSLAIDIKEKRQLFLRNIEVYYCIARLHDHFGIFIHV